VAGIRAKGSLVDRRFEDRVFRKAGWVSPVVLVDGMVAGVWGHERSGGRIQVTVEPFQRLSGEQRRQLGEEATGWGASSAPPRPSPTAADDGYPLRATQPACIAPRLPCRAARVLLR
jgi:DNA glycosylase AlkZ-like